MVHNNELVVEEKAVYSIEKFLVARRLMYWQAYLHKAVLSAENMLVKILERAKLLAKKEAGLFSSTPLLDEFLRTTQPSAFIKDNLGKFCELDDYDVVASVKKWMHHPDKVLNTLSQWLLNRNMLKTRLQMHPIDQNEVRLMQQKVQAKLSLNDDELSFFVFDGIAENRMYNPGNERINILFKDGTVKDISEIEYGLIHKAIESPVKKFYLCHPSIK